jgi:outer membrane protein assembly factor BamA
MSVTGIYRQPVSSGPNQRRFYNAGMRSRPAVTVFWMVCLSVFCLSAQDVPPASAPRTPHGGPCPVPKSQSPGALKVSQVTFKSYKLSLSTQEKIAHLIEQKVEGSSIESVTALALAQAEEELQNRGYFKATVSSEGTTLNAEPPQTVSLTIRVEEGPCYRLGRITFKNNRAVANTRALRSVFPIKDGELFSREKIALGLEKLRFAYGELGYLNFTSIPNTRFDEERRLGFLDIDINEGMQFYIRSIDILGVNPTTREGIL